MEDAYFPVVVQAVPGPDKTVYAYFSDGSIHLFDMKPIIDRGGVFSPLADDRCFAEAITVLNDTVAWDLQGKHDPTDCIDIDPWVIYEAPAVADPLEVVA